MENSRYKQNEAAFKVLRNYDFMYQKCIGSNYRFLNITRCLIKTKMFKTVGYC